MKQIACLLVVGLLVLGQEDKDAWKPIEERLGHGMNAVKKRDAALAYAHVKKALDGLEERVREDWVRLLTFKKEGWTFFKPNIQVNSIKSGKQTVSDIKGTANGRRPADGVIVIFHVTSSSAHVDFVRQKFADPKRRPAGAIVEKRGHWLVAKEMQKMKTVATLMGEHTIISITLSRDDRPLLNEMIGWLDLDLAKRLDDATGRARSG